MALTALVMFTYVHNVHGMEITPHQEEKAHALAHAIFTNPSQSFELLQAFVDSHKEDACAVNAFTGNTLLHDNVIEICSGGPDVRLLLIAALLASGADPNKPNLNGQTALQYAKSAGDKAVIDLLMIEKPDKQTLLGLVSKYEIEDLKPMLLEQ